MNFSPPSRNRCSSPLTTSISRACNSGGKTVLLVAVVLVVGAVAVVAHSPGAFIGGPVVGGL